MLSFSAFPFCDTLFSSLHLHPFLYKSSLEVCNWMLAHTYSVKTLATIAALHWPLLDTIGSLASLYYFILYLCKFFRGNPQKKIKNSKTDQNRWQLCQPTHLPQTISHVFFSTCFPMASPWLGKPSQLPASGMSSQLPDRTCHGFPHKKRDPELRGFSGFQVVSRVHLDKNPLKWMFVMVCPIKLEDVTPKLWPF